ncbi:Copper resistance protein B [hydrothermal vent metagenome]|uniref:Copper resistance protein B n=1 Tax=hydrothermal vent metagenome TaxID=652676 RepID=A0A3B1AX92_9ZZZZ
MKNKLTMMLMGSLVATSVYAGGVEENPTLTKVMINQFESRSATGSDPLILEADMWIGKDLNKLWFKTDIERVNSKTSEFELQALYSRAIAPFWDLQVGVRKDFNPKPTRDWLVLGLNGLAPYFFEVDTAVFIGEQGRLGLRLDAEYEILFTQKLILTPDVSINIHSKDDPQTGTGSGLSDIQLGLRLRYEIVREFAPYIGINWNKKYGQTADYARADGEDISDAQFVVGIRAWF